MSEDLPSGELVRDPVSGRERDAFPGEVIPEEQKTALDRLMDAAVAEYERVRGLVARTGQYSEEELDLLSQMGRVYAEEQRKDYLEQLRAGPVNKIRELLDALPDTNVKKTSTADLNTKVSNVKNIILGKINAAKIRDQSLTITQAVGEYFNDNNNNPNGVYNNVVTLESANAIDDRVLTGLAKTLGIVPSANPSEISSYIVGLPSTAPLGQIIRKSDPKNSNGGWQFMKWLLGFFNLLLGYFCLHTET